LYNKKLGLVEDQLWEPNWQSDLEGLYLDKEGNSKDKNIYTRDIIERTNVGEGIFLPKKDEDIYVQTIENLNKLKQDNVISDFKPYAYDWRIGFDDIIQNGSLKEDGSQEKLIDELRTMADNSETGKVTIMAHSMGGLLAKRFIQTLNEEDKKLIDKVILIASPQVGTPEGTFAVLNGLDFKRITGLLAPRRHTRALAKNMVTAHILGPSQKYFDVVNTKPIEFTQKLLDNNGDFTPYGQYIDNKQELNDFISCKEGRRDALFDEVKYPGCSPAYVTNTANITHAQIDKDVFPEDIKVYQIAGIGKQTIKKIQYDFVPLTTSTELYYSANGDGTVVEESATYLKNRPIYFMDLALYNKNNNTNFDHKNLPAVEPVINLVNQIINNQESVYVDYIINNNNEYKNKPIYALSMHSPVDIHLYDKDGRHTGPVDIEIDGQMVRFIEEEIPNTHYTEIDEEKYITFLDPTGLTLKLDGYNTGTFTLNIDTHIDAEKTPIVAFNNIQTTANLTGSIDLSHIQNNTPLSLFIDTDGDTTNDYEYRQNEIIDLKPKTPIYEISTNPNPAITHAAVLIVPQTNTVATETKQLPQAQGNTPTQPIKQEVTTETKQENTKPKITKPNTKKPTPKPIKKQTVAKPKQPNTNSGIIQTQSKPKSQNWFKRIINKLGR
jgi:hypothetical protein